MKALVCATMGLMIVLAGMARAELEPAISTRGRLLFSDDFSGASPKPEWKAIHGTRWAIEDGAFKGIASTKEYQAKREHHTGATPSINLEVPAHDCIVQMEFKLSGGLTGAHFGFNHGTTREGTGHVCRVAFSTRDGMALQKDKNAQLDGDEDEVLATSSWKPELDRWYTLLFEVRGDEFAARVAGGPTLKMKHARIDVPKTWLNLKSRGGSGQGVLCYDKVRMWEALPKTVADLPVAGGWKKHVIKPPGKGMVNSAQANDWDGDGAMDVIASYDGHVVLLKGPQWKEFPIDEMVAGRSRMMPRPHCIHSTIMDVDGDGDMDFCGSNQTVFWLECPDDPFSGQPWTYRTIDDEILGTHCLLEGDVNRDGKLDLIANSGRGAPQTKFPNSLTWLEVPPDPHRAQSWVRHVFGDQDAPGGSHYAGLGDVNGDGRPDISFAAKGGEGFEGGQWFAWWEQPRDPAAVWKKHLLAADQVGATNILPADLNGDGRADFLASRGHGKGVLWFKGPEFELIEIDPAIVSPHCLVAVDLDGDGDIDGATCSKDPGGHTTWHENDGSGRFTRHEIGTDQGSYDLRAVDMDRDRDLDLLIAGHTSNNIVWFENPGK